MATTDDSRLYDAIQLCDKPFEEMTLPELLAERMCHQWHKYKLHDAKFALARKRHWLEENRPIPTIEELTQRYEDGEYTTKQFNVAKGRRVRDINYRMRVEDELEYADKAEFAEAAKVAYLDELIAVAESEKERRKNAGRTYYDPRKRETRRNQNPQRRWQTRKQWKPLPKLTQSRKRWYAYKASDADYVRQMRKTLRVTTWDADRFRLIARDRGYYSDESLAAIISETLDCTLIFAKRLIKTGRISFNQCLVLGSLFEMTPKEFCDAFLGGYFKEVGESGVFRAYVEDPKALLTKPKQQRRKEGEDEEDDDTDDSLDGTDIGDV